VKKMFLMGLVGAAGVAAAFVPGIAEAATFGGILGTMAADLRSGVEALASNGGYIGGALGALGSGFMLKKAVSEEEGAHKKMVAGAGLAASALLFAYTGMTEGLQNTVDSGGSTGAVYRSLGSVGRVTSSP
jgi:hypothetical protein